MEFKEGHYYEVQWYDVSSTLVKWFFKFKSIRNDKIATEYLINEDLVFVITTPFTMAISDIYKEICLSEFINYLPNNHPDRIIYRKKRINKLLNGI